MSCVEYFTLPYDISDIAPLHDFYSINRLDFYRVLVGGGMVQPKWILMGVGTRCHGTWFATVGLEK